MVKKKNQKVTISRKDLNRLIRAQRQRPPRPQRQQPQPQQEEEFSFVGNRNDSFAFGSSPISTDRQVLTDSPELLSGSNVERVL